MKPLTGIIGMISVSAITLYILAKDVKNGKKIKKIINNKNEKSKGC